MNTGSAAGLPSASAHCCHLPMRSGRGPGTRRPQRTRLRLGPSRPLTAQPHGLRPQTRLGRQTATSPGAHSRRRGRRAERAPLRPPRHPRPPRRPGRSLCTAPTYGRGKRAPRCPGATSPVTPHCPAGGGHAPPVRRLRLVLGPRLAPRQRPESVPTVHWSRPKGSATGAGHATPPHPGRPSPACCPQGKRFTFSRLRWPPGVGQLSDSWLAPRRCGSTPDGL